MTELGVDFGFGVGVDRRRSEIMVAVWVWFALIGVSWVKWWIGMVSRGLWVLG